MKRTFELHDRLSTTTMETPLGRLSAARYASGGAYLGLPAGDNRVVVVFPDGEEPFYGVTERIEPFGSDDIEQPHLKLTVEGEPLRFYN